MDLKNRKNEKMPKNSQFWACFGVFEQSNLFRLNFAVAVKLYFVSSVRSSNSHPDLLVIQQQHHPLFQITPVLNTGLSLSEPLQLYQRQSLDSSAG